MEWKVKYIFNFDNVKPWKNGRFGFGFYGKKGESYMLQWDENWLGHLTPDDHFTWTAGPVDKGLSDIHIHLDVKHPHYICESPDGSLLLSSNGNSKIFKIYPDRGTAELFIDALEFGIKEYNTGNCVYDLEGNIWINDIRGCKVWKFSQDGKLLRTLGDGIPGFQAGLVSFDEVRFNWIYDLRLGPDGNIYVLDSKNFAVRMIDLENKLVSTVVGTGRSGDSIDGVDASQATFGSKEGEYFDGPLSLSLDEEGNIYVGDTFNHVLRMVDRSTNIITTIAGRKDIQSGVRANPEETDPLKLNIPKISSLEYYDGCIFIPEYDGDLVVLEKINTNISL
jgi:hypothetical protein